MELSLNLYWYVSEKTFARMKLNVDARGAEYFKNKVTENLKEKRDSYTAGGMTLEDGGYDVDLRDYYRSCLIIDLLSDGFMDSAAVETNELDTSPRDYIVEILLEKI